MCALALALSGAIFRVSVAQVVPASNEGRIHLPYPHSGVALGQGFNLTTSQPTSAVCILFRSAVDGSQAIFTKSQEFVDHSTLTETFGWGLTAGPKLFSTTAGNFMKLKLDIRRESVIAVGRVEASFDIVRPDTTTGLIALRQERLAELRSNRETFTRLCGTHYVERISRAAFAVAVATLLRSTSDRLDSVNAAFTTNVLDKTAWNATQSHILNRYVEQQLLTVQLWRVGGSGATGIATEKAGGFAELIATLPAVAGELAQPYEVELAPYTATANWPQDLPLSYVVGMATLLKRYEQFDFIYRYLREASLDTASYVWPDIPADSASIATQNLFKYLVDLERAVSACAAAGSDCAAPSNPHMPASDLALRVRLPVRKGSFDADLELRSWLVVASEVDACWDKIRPRWFPPGTYQNETRKNTVCPHLGANVDAFKARAEAQPAQKALLLQRWAAALKEERIRRWLRVPIARRCSRNLSELECVGPLEAAEMEAAVQTYTYR